MGGVSLRRWVLVALPWFLVATFGCASSPRRVATESVEQVLDDWHAAAARADGEAYFGAFTADAVFLGTDASERWDVEGFRAYAMPYFSQGRGWTYEPFDRHVVYSEDGDVAWFDERLRNAKYGELRGTGALRLTADGWRIAHYNMSFPVPNALTRELVDRIRELEAQAD